MSTNNQFIVEDLSDNNPLPNLDEYWNAGHRILFTKATESDDYTWSDAQHLAKIWHQKGGLQGWYAFLRPTATGEAQADKFWEVVGPEILNGDFVTADCEVNGVGPKLLKEFIDRINWHAKRNKVYVRGLIYGSPGFLIPKRIRKYGGWLLWEAEYGPVAKPVPSWRTWFLWQYTDMGTVAGSSHTVDLSRARSDALRPRVVKGDRNFAVLDLKHELHKAGYRGFSLKSQVYGAGTVRAVRKFKADHKWKKPNGNLAGRRVWKALGQ